MPEAHEDKEHRPRPQLNIQTLNNLLNMIIDSDHRIILGLELLLHQVSR